MTSNEIFMNNFNMLLAENNMTQSQFAEEAGFAFQTVNRWSNGHFSPPLASLDRIAEKFGITVSDLLDENLGRNRQIHPIFRDLTENYEALYRHLFGEYSEPPHDLIRVFNIVAKDVLNETQWYILTRHYNLDGCGFITFREISERFNVTFQRIQQISARAEFLLRGVPDRFTKAEKSLKKTETVDISEESMKNIQALFGDCMIQYAFDKNEGHDAVSDRLKDIPTQDIMGISTHTKNSLMRNKLFTLNEILSVSDEELVMMTGIGRGAIQEVRILREMYAESRNIPDRTEDDNGYA